MTTNVIQFERPYLVKFVKYHLDKGDRIERYIRTWALINATKPPADYRPKPTTKLKNNEFVIRLSGENTYIGRFWLSLTFQRELENIVSDIFNAIVFRELLSKMWEEKLPNAIERIAERYGIEYDHVETIRKRFYRLRTELYEPERHNTGESGGDKNE